MNYLNRYIEKEIIEALETSGAVVIAGPKFCGKTTTAKLFSKSSYVLDTKAKIEFTKCDPLQALKGETPRLIDEWQNVPDLWNCARSEVDSRDEKFGQFIFTGSSTPADMNDIYHSGAGRIVTLYMRTMSLAESGESTCQVSLSSLFNNPTQNIAFLNNNYSLNDTAFYICRGGWPLSLLKDGEKALKVTENYYSSLFNFENTKNNSFRNKKESIFQMILKSYARNISTEARRKTIIEDVNLHDDRNLDPNTFDEYVKALKDLYIIKDIEAWNPNLRSKTSIITTPTRHFVDTSIACGALNISPSDLMNDPNSFGLFFEDFAVKELSIYANSINGELKHYRDSNGLECDAVIHLKNGDYALVEIKLGGEDLINEGINSLNSIKDKLIKANLKEPKFSMIITACGDCYTTKGGIYIVPINMLKN